jgi:DNA-binding transcriptional LysR family regulator
MPDLRTLLARGLALLWAGFWLFFVVAESLAWHTPIAVMAPWVGAGLLFVLLAVFAWRSELTGGVLLVVTGALAGLTYLTWPPAGLSPVVRLVTAAMLGVPPILAGVLFLTHHHFATRGGPA